ncbi:MAG: hypothetical protein ACP5TZ_03505, partial [Nitrososphaeria archaeon]
LQYAHMKVIFDTSFIVMITEGPTPLYQQLVNIYDKVDPVVTRSVLRELDKVSKRKRIKVSGFVPAEIVEYNNNADDDIVRLAAERKIPVITMDIELGKRLRSKGLTCLTGSKNKLIYFR